MTIQSVWKPVAIRDMGKVVTGRTPPTQTTNYFGDEYPFVTPSDMAGEKWISQTDRGLSSRGASLLKNNRVPANSVIVSCIGWQMGKVAKVRQDSFTNQQINSIIPHGSVDSDFLHYSLSTRREELKTLGSVGTRTPILNKSRFAELTVPLPPITTQRKIASVLSTYDDLIENNTRRIEILEEMAQAIYREWFVNFRFPGHEQVEMVNSDWGPIPEGWNIERLNEVLSALESGKRPKGGIRASDRDVPSIGAENITGLGKYDYSKEKYISQDFFDSMKRGRIQDKDVLLYKDGAHIGKKSMFRDGYPHAVCCINEHVFILRTNGICTQSYLYFWLDQPKMTENIKNLNANAAQPGGIVKSCGLDSVITRRPSARFSLPALR